MKINLNFTINFISLYSSRLYSFLKILPFFLILTTKIICPDADLQYSTNVISCDQGNINSLKGLNMYCDGYNMKGYLMTGFKMISDDPCIFSWSYDYGCTPSGNYINF